MGVCVVWCDIKNIYLIFFYDHVSIPQTNKMPAVGGKKSSRSRSKGRKGGKGRGRSRSGSRKRK
jgi:hypothetical protein